MNAWKDTYLPRRFFAGMLTGAAAFVVAYAVPVLLVLVAVGVVVWLAEVVVEVVGLYRVREGMEADREVADKLKLLRMPLIMLSLICFSY